MQHRIDCDLDEDCSCSPKVSMTSEEYVAWIEKNRIRYCGSTPCPRCGTESPCCDHVEVDIGVGVQTGEHTYHCTKHGAFGFSYATGEVIFQDDGP